MNRLEFFALITHKSGDKYWTELVTMRAGELAARRSIFSLIRGRRMADQLADRYQIKDRAGIYAGTIIRVP